MQPRNFLFSSQTPMTPTSGSVGPAGSKISGLPRPGCVMVRPSRILNRPVEGHRLFITPANTSSGSSTGIMSLADRFDDGLLDFIQILRIGAGGLLIGQLL